MKNTKKYKKTPIKSSIFRIFTTLILIFTALLYLMIAILIYLQYSGEISMIYTEEATHFLLSIVLGLFILGWFFAYSLYIGIIKPIYDTFSIIVESVDELVNQEDINRDQVIYLNEFVKNSLEQLNKSSLTQKMNITLNTESYIKKLSELIKQNEELTDSKQELALIVNQLEEQKDLLELEKAKTNSIIDSLPNGLLVVSKDGNIFLVNQEVEKLLNINQNDLLGKFIYNILPEIQYDQIESNDKVNNVNSFNYVSKDKKKNIKIETTHRYIRLNNDILGSVYILRDTTKEMETDRAQKEFISLASHQLRTPITSIKWNSESILSNKNIDLDIKSSVNDIYQEGVRMEKLVNSLLHLSRIDLGKIEFNIKDIQLNKYIQDLLKTLKSEINAKNLSIEQDIVLSDIIQNDPVYLDIIITNILYNAIRYNNINGIIKIKVKKITGQEKILLAISDTGIGIPLSQQAQIFSRLFRADNAKSLQPDGNGLGLYVVKKLVELMQGNIWFDSKQNQGTTFFIELPIVIKL